MVDWTESLPYRERPCRFGRDDTLVGMVCHPVGAPTGIPILILGAGIVHKVGPSRVSVRLARALAVEGHPSLRFDLSGIGDSVRRQGSSLRTIVQDDIRDALTFLLGQCPEWQGGAGLVGFCSGADNGFFLAADDRRISYLALYDPRIHKTPGFHRRRALRRLTRNPLHSVARMAQLLWNRSTRASRRVIQRPPGYYGLLASTADEADQKAAQAVARDVRFLYCLSSGVHDYCDGPEQVRESLPSGYSEEHMTVVWRPDLDHILSDLRQQDEFIDLLRGWLSETCASKDAVPSSGGLGG